MQRFWLPIFAVPLLLAACKTNEAAPTPAAPSSAQPATVASTAPAASTAAPSTSASAPASLLAKGAPAPDFHLEGSDGKTHALADSVGKQVVVIAWFPKAFTSG